MNMFNIKRPTGFTCTRQELRKICESSECRVNLLKKMLPDLKKKLGDSPIPRETQAIIEFERYINRWLLFLEEEAERTNAPIIKIDYNLELG